MRSRRNRIPRPPIVAALALLLVLALPTRPAAHEIPPNVLVRMFVRPAGDVLTVLVRVPLEAMRDIDFPLFGPGYLDIAAVDSLLEGPARMWIADYLALHEEGRPLPAPEILATRISLPSDPSFGSFEAARAHMDAPMVPAGTELPWQQALLDVALAYPIADEDARFSITPGLAHLGIRTTTVLHFLPPDRPERVLQYAGDPGTVRLDPRWHQAFFRFVGLGFHHILDGVDHLLFLLCLVIPFRRVRPLVVLVTAFTVAHSVTLIASASGLAPDALWFPPLIETLIAASIVYMAFENIVGATQPQTSPDGSAGWLQRRWLIAFGFGLVHGFGFSFLLRESLQFAGSHVATSLIAFNVGVELGQLLVVLIAVPVLDLLFRRVVAERVGTILLSALVAHTAWHWMTERGGALAQYDLAWPALDLALLAAAMRWLMLLLIVLGAVWLLLGLFRRFGGGSTTRPVSSGAAASGVIPVDR
jgi:hypothetical protein